MNIDWEDLGSTLFGCYYFAQQYVYPGLTPQDIIASVADGTIFGHLVNIAIVWYTMRFKTRTTKIQYITPDK